jgi:regulator of sigma D
MAQAVNCWLHTTENLVQCHDRLFGIHDKKNDDGAEVLNTSRTITPRD